mmetsp:Transcript_13817/g.26517  ORF Transcript_13817/g.26517 Transcript_13817/m.26517 type:complete len:207 (-) Transcript_13817:87-707(-)
MLHPHSDAGSAHDPGAEDDASLHSSAGADALQQAARVQGGGRGAARAIPVLGRPAHDPGGSAAAGEEGEVVVPEGGRGAGCVRRSSPRSHCVASAADARADRRLRRKLETRSGGVELCGGDLPPACSSGDAGSHVGGGRGRGGGGAGDGPGSARAGECTLPPGPRFHCHGHRLARQKLGVGATYDADGRRRLQGGTRPTSGGGSIV